MAAVAALRDFTFAAVGSDIVCSRRAAVDRVLSGHAGRVTHLALIGRSGGDLEERLVSLSAEGEMLVWDVVTDPTGTGPKRALDLGEEPLCLAQPPTYLNKVVVGCRSGACQLWNVSTGQRLYEFSGWGSAVQCLDASPALDVVSFGLADGRAVLHNLKFDETVLVFKDAALGSGLAVSPAAGASRVSPGGRPTQPVECVCFVTSGGGHSPLLAVAGKEGAITLWDLEKRQLHTIIRAAHNGPVVTLHYSAKDRLLMSTGEDNSIKHWAVGQDGETECRLLRFRCGHSGPPTSIHYYKNGQCILSAGRDKSFRFFSTIQDQQSRELSQHHVQRRAKKLKIREEELKLPPVCMLAFSELRERDWCNIVTAHEGETSAYTWRLEKFALGEYLLLPPERESGILLPKPQVVTSVAVSCCGNIALVGSAAGRLDRYNLQSGIHGGGFYRRFPKSRKAAKNGSEIQFAHDGPVVGITSDPCNTTVVTGGDECLRVWDFKTKRQDGDDLEVGDKVQRIAHHRPTHMVGVVAGLNTLLIDITSRQVVRRFPGKGGEITDLEFSDDGYWLLSSSLDCTVTVWDIPSGRALQVLHLSRPVTSVSLTPKKDMLATTHTNMIGIYLWANQVMYCPGSDDVVSPSSQPVPLALPVLNADLNFEESDPLIVHEEGRNGGDSEGAGDETPLPADWREPPAENADSSGFPIPLAPHLATLSLLSRSSWHSLIHLDEIKERNRPKEAPKKPEAAPFFLPTVQGLERDPVFDLNGNNEEDAEQQPSKVLHGGFGDVQSKFLSTLKDGMESSDFAAAIELLRNMSPSAIHGEIHMMEVLEGAEGEDIENVRRTLGFLRQALESNCNVEFIQAFLAVFLKVHNSTILRYEELHVEAEGLKRELTSAWQRLDDKLSELSCLTGFFLKING